MFCVAYILAAQKKVIVPIHWIKEVTSQFAKYLNNGINRNQFITIYYSHSAMDEIIAGANADDFQPPFDNLLVIFPETGCYKAKPYKCFGENAKSYSRHPGFFNNIFHFLSLLF